MHEPAKVQRRRLLTDFICRRPDPLPSHVYDVTNLHVGECDSASTEVSDISNAACEVCKSDGTKGNEISNNAFRGDDHGQAKKRARVLKRKLQWEKLCAANIARGAKYALQ